MRLLLDTHIAIWATTEPSRLKASVRSLLDEGENDVFVSLVSLWEIAIKWRSRRTDAPPFSAEEAAVQFERSGFDFLDVTVQDIVGVQRLPTLHKDPFDRLLISQALARPLRLVTHDRQLAGYSDTVIVS